MRPRLLDLFCCAGGAAMGYHRAGFDIVGVDIDPQPNYPFEFHQADAMAYPLDGFDAVHASPPCKDHTSMVFTDGGRRDPHGTGWMLPAIIKRLAASGRPYVVENVPAADMPGAFTLCGRSFGIAKLRRHRQFLTNVPILVPPCGCRPGAKTLGVYGDLSKNDRRIGRNPDGYVRMRAGFETARELLGCPWMDAHELTQAIPPVYTEHIGGYLIAAIGTDRAPRMSGPICPPCQKERWRWLETRPSQALPWFGIAHGSGAPYDVSGGGLRDRGRTNYERWRQLVRFQRDLIARTCREQRHTEAAGVVTDHLPRSPAQAAHAYTELLAGAA